MALRFLKDKFFCGLDIGAYSLKASLIRTQDHNNLELLGVHEVRTQGIKNSSESKKYKAITDRKEAIKVAIKMAKHNDTVIITGKGAEPLMCLANGQKIPWDDREIVRELMPKI